MTITDTQPTLEESKVLQNPVSVEVPQLQFIDKVIDFLVVEQVAQVQVVERIVVFLDDLYLGEGFDHGLDQQVAV